MNVGRIIAGFALACVACSSLAAAPQLKASESVTINAPVSAVWDKVKSFDSLNNWHPAVAKDGRPRSVEQLEVGSTAAHQQRCRPNRRRQ